MRRRTNPTRNRRSKLKRWVAVGGAAAVLVTAALIAAVTRATLVTAPQAQEMYEADRAAAAEHGPVAVDHRRVGRPRGDTNSDKSGAPAVTIGDQHDDGVAVADQHDGGGTTAGEHDDRGTIADQHDDGETVATRPAAPADTSPPAAGTKPTKTSRRPAHRSKQDPPRRRPGIPEVRLPAEGVYAYTTTGGESFSGYEFRSFPRTTYRTIVHQRQGWADHHVFLRERQSWSTFQWAGQRRLVPSTRNRVVFGPVVIDETITFDPPMVTSRLPWRAGRAWSGTFKGETYGSYRSRTIERTTIAVEGTPVDVWLDELDLELHGSLEGTVLVKRWVSPLTGVTVQEVYDADVAQGPFTYNATWSVTVQSLTPKGS